MKKMLFLVIFVFFALLQTAEVKETKKIFKLQKAYIYQAESLLISETDLNCTYFIKDRMPQDIRIVASYQPDALREDFSDFDMLFINQGSRDGRQAGDMLLIISQGRHISGLGRYYLKESLAEITKTFEDRSLVRLNNCCHPVHIGDLAIPFKPEKTVFARSIDYLSTRIPENPVSGNIVFSDLMTGVAATMSATSQYVTVDMGQGVVGKGTFLLICRSLKRDLPLLIIGLGIVIHVENTHSTVKILEASSDVQVHDQVMLLVAPKTDDAGTDSAGNIPVVDTLPAEGQDEESAQSESGDAAAAGQTYDELTVDVLFDFDSRQPKGDHSGDYTAIREFINARTEYIVTLRGYTCSIGSEEYNLRLAKERVEGIKNMLISQYGIDGAHVETYFYGEKETNFDNSLEAERQKNRLVKITVSGK